MTGIFSLVHVVLDMQPAEILDKLHLSREIRSAILAGEGPLGALLGIAHGGAGRCVRHRSTLAGTRSRRSPCSRTPCWRSFRSRGGRLVRPTSLGSGRGTFVKPNRGKAGVHRRIKRMHARFA
ncbi:MAG: Predicted signal transduction protein [uncultured Caballeronia sp.]|nr:MAG: Predicted signal transduction protein [uncultured Caballeronia sp.]